MNPKVISLAALIFILAGCSENKVSDFPNLALSAPLSGQIYHPGDTIWIRGNASASTADDAHLLHDVMVELNRQSDSATLFSAYFDAHELESFDFDTFCITPPVGTMTYAFVQTQVENHIPKITSASVSVMIHP